MQYFQIKRENGDRYPLFDWAEDSLPYRQLGPIEIDRPLQLCISEPVPGDMCFADYHPLPRHVFSQRVAEVVAGMGLPGVQLLPCDVALPNGENKQGYHYLNIYNAQDLMDMDASKYRKASNGSILKVKNLVLSREKIQSIDEANRHMLCLPDPRSVQVVSEKVKDAIMALDPTGLRFEPVEVI